MPTLMINICKVESVPVVSSFLFVFPKLSPQVNNPDCHTLAFAFVFLSFFASVFSSHCFPVLFKINSFGAVETLNLLFLSQSDPAAGGRRCFGFTELV